MGLHGSARTTEAVHRTIQHSQESVRALARRSGINPKTVRNWRCRTSLAQLLRRQILWLGGTAHLSAEWIARQLTEACGWEWNRSNIIRDHDVVFGENFSVGGFEPRALGFALLFGALLKNRAVPAAAQAASQCFDVWHEQLPCTHLPNERFRGHV
jgi:hypothetical protein